MMHTTSFPHLLTALGWPLLLALTISCSAPASHRAEERDNTLFASRKVHLSMAAGAPTYAMESVDLAMEPPPAPAEETRKGAAQRMVFYQGQMSLRSTQPALALDSAEARARALGGRTESRSGQEVVLLVPVAEFRSFFDALESLGSVVSKTIHAEDITDTFQDNELRMRIQRATLDRLKQLLTTASNDEEKNRLLQDITRITEDLLVLENRKRILESQAAFSRITLYIQPYILHPRSGDNTIEAFAWMQQLHPRRDEAGILGSYLRWSPPQNMLELEIPKPAWAASASDGAVFWTWKRRNNPRGDAEFWLAALRAHLSESFASTADTTQGAFRILRLEAHGTQPYVWYIAVATHRRDLYLAQAYFPSKAIELKHRNALFQTLAGGRP